MFPKSYPCLTITTKEHDEFYRNAGISRETIWIQRSPPGSGAPDLEVISIETDDLANMLKEFATSNHPWAIKFREFAKKAFGLDFSGPPPPLNENLVDWKQSILVYEEVSIWPGLYKQNSSEPSVVH